MPEVWQILAELEKNLIFNKKLFTVTGSIVLLLGQVLKGALVECGGDLDMWYNGRRPNHRDTLNIFQNLLGDELVSAITTKHILTGALTFLPSFLGSIHRLASRSYPVMN